MDYNGLFNNKNNLKSQVVVVVVAYSCLLHYRLLHFNDKSNL